MESKLPEGWEWKTILEVCDKITSGGTPSRKKSEYYGGSIPWVKSGDLNDGILNETSEKITQEAKRFAKELLEANRCVS